MVNCSVPLCTSYSQKKNGVTFHEYPSDGTLRVKWLKAVSRQEENSDKPWQPSGRATVCSNHFLPSDFKAGLKRKKLIAGAVPSVFDGYPAYKQMPQKPQRREIVRVKVQATTTNARKKKRVASPELCPSTTFDPQLQSDEESYNVEQRTSHASVETMLTSAKLDIRERKHTLLQQRYRRQSKRMAELKNTVKKLRAENKCLKEQHSKYNIDALEEDCINGNNKAEFLREQLLVYKLIKTSQWAHKTVKYCVMWHCKSPTAYCFVRKAGLLTLPSRSTLKRYVGSTSGERVNTLIKKRLQQEAAKVTELDKYGSLIIDEMSMKPMSTYIKSADEVVGNVSMNGLEKDIGLENVLANKLLCFVFVGLCSHFKIPAAYFFTNGLKAEELHQLTLHVIKEVELVGFKVVRIVADGHSTNVKLFGLLSGGKPLPRIVHPLDSERPLFLSFDPCHILKNFRSLLLASNRQLTNQGKPISGQFLRDLYKLQKDSVIKPVRCLSYKHVYPTNLDKMNVGRAVDIFSHSVIAALQFLKEHGPLLGNTSFKEAEGAVEETFAINNFQ